ncbi:hypothetical protein EW145_g5389 [Phellinidium pouzarii]|uniref:Uncharacterized protein n=1 Tax=Phellinidium pouzarii TaxID=167371 RepID=A0A4S4L1G8_9AGAM|nr:hypothetical protein EW145_g5389 [Phellinidium pouzarii]
MESEDGRESPSTIEAIAGSAYPSAAPSRSASTSTRDMTRAWEKLVGAHAYGSGSRALPEVPLASMGEVRRVSSDSRWSWSNRATFQMDEDVESLPAYSVRRSRSLASVGAQTLASRSPSLRSRSRSRRSSTGRPDSRIHSGGPGGSRSRPSSRNAIAELSPSSLEFPIELARKIAQTYPRTPPPPEYYGT